MEKSLKSGKKQQLKNGYKSERKIGWKIDWISGLKDGRKSGEIRLKIGLKIVVGKNLGLLIVSYISLTICEFKSFFFFCVCE